MTASVVLGAGCSIGDDPDPRLYAPLPMTVTRGPAWDPPVPVVAAVDPYAAPPSPAPLVEPRPAAPRPATTRIALGQHAVHVIDDGLQRGFDATASGHTAVFLPRTDRDAIDLLLLGEADFAVVGTQLSPREQQAGLQQSRLGVELFALAVAPDSPVRSLTRQQVRQVFTGAVTDWQQLGLPSGPIVAVAPAEQRKAERAARTLLPGDGFAESVVRVASNRHVADQILQHPTAIGIVTIDADKVSGMQLIAIDWCPPTPEAYEHGTYPFGVPVHLVTAGPPAGEARRFLDYLRGTAREQLTARLCLP
ncbi:MAG: substrate-binding domain-containing protein [Planctomycetes bacterium]|nr:substrate-binding domain-containing protein [Planctomycetota bacterium]